MSNRTKAMVALLFFVCSSVNAQLSEYIWAGNNISSVLASKEEDLTDESQIYFYNLGTKQYLNVGSDWGTKATVNKVGVPFLAFQSDLKDSKNRQLYQFYTTWVLTSQGSYLSWVTKQGSNTRPGIYGDRAKNLRNNEYVSYFSLEETSKGSKIYRIKSYQKDPLSHEGYYLKVNPNKPADPITFAESVDNNDQYSQWKIITRKDFKNRLNAQYMLAKYTDPADATFFIQDQGITRSVDAITKKYWNENGLTYKQETAGDLIDNGKYWHAYITGNQNGTVSQKIKVTQPGWYRITCDGFFYGNYRSSIKSYLYATCYNKVKVGNKESTVKQEFKVLLNDLSNTSSSVKGGNVLGEGITLYNGDYKDNAVLIRIEDNDENEDNLFSGEIELGIKVEGSNNSYDRTVFDNFQMTYCGRYAILLDELNGSIEQINDQVKPKQTQTLWLQRTLEDNKWNSIILPVSLTKQQFTNAFGDHPKLATLSDYHKGVIEFTSVDIENMDDNEIVLQEGKLYIIKPTKEGQFIDGRECFFAPGVVLDKSIKTSNNGIVEDKTLNSGSSMIQFFGTYLNITDKIIPTGSYILANSKSCGWGWYHTAQQCPVKGFRCWIQESEKHSSQYPAKLNFNIDGEETTEINITTVSKSSTIESRSMYNLSGQRVNASYRGIVIKNGRKYLSK